MVAESLKAPLLKTMDPELAMKDEKESVPSLFSQLALLGAVSTAAFGALMFGYSLGVLNTSQNFIAHEFGWSVSQKSLYSSLITSAMPAGATVGSLVAGNLVETRGRKTTMQLNALVMLIGSVIAFLSWELFSLLIGRFISGLAVAIIAMCSPLYIAEISPPQRRGMFGTFPQLGITGGIMLSFAVGLYLPESPSTPTNWWRWMFLIGSVPALLQLVLFTFFFDYESPNWLIAHNKKDLARETLIVLLGDKVEGQRQYEALCAEHMQAQAQATQAPSWSDLFAPSNLKAVIIGLGISVCQQFTGINAVMFFSNNIFDSMGLSNSTAATVLSGVVNFVACCVSLLLIDKLGRRTLLLVGSVGMGISLAAVVIFTSLKVSSAVEVVSVVSLCAYIAFFAISLGPITWILLSEIFAENIRGMAVGLCATSNWFSVLVIGLSFLPLVEATSMHALFITLAVICFLTTLFVSFCIPETKGKSLAEIQAGFSRKTA
eukprot:GILI01014093.1.p1 GENE.GILI01014093.1~~GILI01014093.1.p1  ORF type:complete len:490 (+),score=167.23 GILI01014093.1:146-1615(+)